MVFVFCGSNVLFVIFCCTIVQEWFIALVASRCCSLQSESFECAQLLQHLDYCSILNIMMAKVIA